MFQNTIGVTGIILTALCLASGWTSAAPMTSSEQAETTGKLKEKLPAGFPVPVEAVGVDQPNETKVEGRVPGYNAEKLVAFFRRELPKNGFTIMAQNPPRVTNYESSPITLIVKTPEGRTQSVQIRVEENGDVVFTVR